jgi:predicted ATP-grasp superfamily ATP-dependent carboligase
MIAAARSIAKHLQLCGLVGFDFVLDSFTSQPHLIEINPRATQINHFPGYGGTNLPAALFGAISNTKISSSAERWTTDQVALFPQEWARDPNSEWFAQAFHDVPLEEPELMRYFADEKTIPRRNFFQSASILISSFSIGLF